MFSKKRKPQKLHFTFFDYGYLYFLRYGYLYWRTQCGGVVRALELQHHRNVGSILVWQWGFSTWHWIGVGCVYSSFLIAPISCSSKPKCAKLMDGRTGNAPETCQSKITTPISTRKSRRFLTLLHSSWRENKEHHYYESLSYRNFIQITLQLYMYLHALPILFLFFEMCVSYAPPRNQLLLYVASIV